jgi:hypothetical protein
MASQFDRINDGLLGWSEKALFIPNHAVNHPAGTDAKTFTGEPLENSLSTIGSNKCIIENYDWSELALKLIHLPVWRAQIVKWVHYAQHASIKLLLRPRLVRHLLKL